MTLILNQAEVRSLLNMSDCISVVEQAFVEFSSGTAVQPLRTNIHSDQGISLYMPAYLEKSQALACKVVSVFNKNPEKYNLPAVLGTVLLQDVNTGKVKCIMDGSYLTAVRTGAASGVATKYLARDEKNMSLGIIGTGVQAEMQALAVKEVRQINKVLIFDLSEKAAIAFKQKLEECFEVEIEIVADVNDIAKADIICTATSSPEPVIDGKKIKKGTHINGIGSHTPKTRELDTVLIKKSVFIGDSKDACFSEAGDFLIPLIEGAFDETHFKAELGEVIMNDKAGRTSKSQITVFKSNGLAVQDAATAAMIYENALKAKVGAEVEI